MGRPRFTVVEFGGGEKYREILFALQGINGWSSLPKILDFLRARKQRGISASDLTKKLNRLGTAKVVVRRGSRRHYEWKIRDPWGAHAALGARHLQRIAELSVMNGRVPYSDHGIVLHGVPREHPVRPPLWKFPSQSKTSVSQVTREAEAAMQRIRSAARGLADAIYWNDPDYFDAKKKARELGDRWITRVDRLAKSGVPRLPVASNPELVKIEREREKAVKVLESREFVITILVPFSGIRIYA